VRPGLHLDLRDDLVRDDRRDDAWEPITRRAGDDHLVILLGRLIDEEASERRAVDESLTSVGTPGPKSTAVCPPANSVDADAE
jgi:hypothetical protein